MKAQAQLPNSDLFFEQWNYNVNTHYWFYTPDTSGYSYQWFLDGIPTTTNDSIQISFPSTGYHLLKLEVNTGTTVRTSFRGIGVKPGLLFPGYISQSDWYFGRYVSLDFGSGSPLLTCASIDNSSTNTHEAIVTVSDNTGNAQFFMDGFSWYDIVNPGPGENHSLITANLGGAPVGPYVSWDFIDNQWDISNHSSQICIVPYPNHPNEYFLFITPQNQNIGNSPYTGLQVVHINNNGVPTFNLIPLGPINNNIQNRTSEYITSTPHCNGTDWWVVTNSQRAIPSTNDYYVYRVSQFGITNGDGTLVNLPDIYPSNTPGFEAEGQLKFSPDGAHLANFFTQMPAGITSVGNFVNFNFNNSTGAITNPTFLNIPPPPAGLQRSCSNQSLSFSPNSNYLYAVFNAIDNNIGAQQMELYRYDVSSGFALSQITNGFPGFFLNMPAGNFTSKIGPDGVIYCNRPGTIGIYENPSQPGLGGLSGGSYYLASITNPDDPNIANVAYNDQSLYYQNTTQPAGCVNSAFTSNRNSKVGFPTMTDAQDPTAVLPVVTVTNIACREYEFSLGACWETYTIQWDFGDGNSGSGNPVIHTYAVGGSYTVVASLFFAGGLYTTTSFVVNAPANPAFTITPGTGAPGQLFTANPAAGFTYTWNGPAANQNGNVFTGPPVFVNTTYTVTATDPNGCTSTQQFLVIPVICPFTLNPGVTSIDIPSNTVQNSSVILPGATVINNLNFHLLPFSTLVINANLQIINCHFICEEGSRIIIPAATPQVSIDNSTFEGCQKMWVGIQINTKVIARNSLFRDAQFAFDIFGLTGTGNLHDNTYENNLFGIRVRGAFANSSIITGNRFICPGTLMAPYIGMPTPHNNKTLAGITLEGLQSLTIGNNSPQYNTNIFSEINCGIKANSGTITVYNSRFNGIQNTPQISGTNPQAYAGRAISADAPQFNGSTAILTIEPWSGESQGNETFVDCRTAIRLNRFSLNSLLPLRIANSVWAIHGSQLINSTVRVIGNNITATDHGIFLEGLDLATQVELRNNILTALTPSTGLFNYGIRTQASNFSSTSALLTEILGNTLNLNNLCAGGIHTKNLLAPNISNNEINLSHQFLAGGLARFRGFYVVNCNHAEVYCNHVLLESGIPITTPHCFADYHVENSTHVKLSCNEASVADRGFNFEGANSNSSFQNNVMQANGDFPNWGLRLGSNSFIGDQPPISSDPPFNNQWLGTFINNTGGGNVGAWSASGTGGSDFKVLNQPQYFPAFSAGANLFWFDQSVNTSGIPGCNSQTCPSPSPNIVGEGNNDEAIALGLIETTDFPEETKWLLRKALFNKIDEQPDLWTANNTLVWFYYNPGSINLSKLKNASNELEEIGIEKQSYLASIVANTDLMIQYNAQAAISYANYLQSSNQSDLDSYDTFMLAKDLLENINQGLETDLQALIQGHANTAHQLNSSMVPNNFSEELEKIVHDIYFRTIAIGIFEFDTLDQQNLSFVAGQCALAYGNPVYMARTMLESLGENWSFDDVAVCSQLGYAKKAKAAPDYYGNPNERGFDFSVQPNPAVTITQVNIHLLDEASRLELFDLNGQLLKSVLIPAGTSVYNLNVSEFSAGLYALKLKSDKYQGVIKLLVK